MKLRYLHSYLKRLVHVCMIGLADFFPILRICFLVLTLGGFFAPLPPFLFDFLEGPARLLIYVGTYLHLPTYLLGTSYLLGTLPCRGLNWCDMKDVTVTVTCIVCVCVCLCFCLRVLRVCVRV